MLLRWYKAAFDGVIPLPTGANFCDRLLSIFLNEKLSLFAGAGVGVHAGLPSWHDFVSHLASVAESYEKLTALLIRTRLKDGRFDEAIRYYKICPLIPEGEKHGHLASPFKRDKYDANKLLQLVKLPFSAIITTNYDGSMHDAWAVAHKQVPISFEYDDGSLKQAAFANEPFIARIHGRELRPEHMVVDTEDYSRLEKNEAYIDFVCQRVLLRQTCLFVGFSFADPAIRKILDLLEKLVGPTYPQKHYALLPSSEAELMSRLAKFNFEVITYPDHTSLWQCFEFLPLRLVEARKPLPTKSFLPLPFENMRSFLEYCYVRSRMSATASPLRDLALHGIVLAIAEGTSAPASHKEISNKLRQIIPLTTNEAQAVVSTAVDYLSAKGWLSETNGVVQIEKRPDRLLDANLETIVRSALDRLIVREGMDAKESYPRAVKQTLEELFLTRGWDLGAQFMGSASVIAPDIYDFLRTRLRNLLPTEPFDKIDRLANSVYDVLRRPDTGEAKILGDLGRLCFGLSVLLQAGSSALRLGALPERLYFDSNILLCAVTDGHPMRPVYESTFRKLAEAAGQTGQSCELVVIEEFLNEIVSHKKLALRLVKELDLEDPEQLHKHILYYGAQNTNVFVGAYGSWVGREKSKVAFQDFLDQAAPFKNEADLATFMNRLGFKVVKIQDYTAEFQQVNRDFSKALAQAYEKWDSRGKYDPKVPLLIEHEARQLAQIELELRLGRRSYFVTADRKLREILGFIRLGTVWNVAISNLGLVEMVDLLLGVETDPSSLSRFLWGIVELDERAMFRNYFIDRASQTRDEAHMMTLPEILDDMAIQAEKAAKSEGIRFYSKRVEDKAKAAKFLDRFEDQFFAKLAEAIERRRRP